MKVTFLLLLQMNQTGMCTRKRGEEEGGKKREDKETEEERKGGEWKGVKRSGPKQCLQLNQATNAPTCLVSSLSCLSTVQETVMANMREEVHMRAGRHRGIVSLPSPGHSAG